MKLLENNNTCLGFEAQSVLHGQKFTKASRLLKKRDFRFGRYDRYRSQHFSFFYTTEGRGRIGISLSKKVLKTAVARNRVRRLLKETFRMADPKLPLLDVHVVGLSQLTQEWEELTLAKVQNEFAGFLSRLGGKK